MRTPCLPWPLLLAMFVGLVSSGEEAWRTNATARITVIKHCQEPFRTFEIVGTDVKGLKKLSDLTIALRKHKEQNPGARYEILAEVKSVAEDDEKTVKAVAKAGITLEHYWAAHSDPLLDGPISPHGVGFVDLIDRFRNIR